MRVVRAASPGGSGSQELGGDLFGPSHSDYLGRALVLVEIGTGLATFADRVQAENDRPVQAMAECSAVPRDGFRTGIDAGRSVIASRSGMFLKPATLKRVYRDDHLTCFTDPARMP